MVLLCKETFYYKEYILSEELKQMAERIKECMREKKLKQVDIVKTTGVSKGSVSKWLAGKAKPSGESLLRLSEVLGESEYWLLNGEYPYSSYEDIDDSMAYFESIEENKRDFYIKELGLDPNLPYSMRFLQNEFEDKMFSEHAEYEHQFELTTEQEKQLKEYYEWLDSENTIEDVLENKYAIEKLEEYSTWIDFEENYKYEEKLLRSQSEIANRANAILDKTLFYCQEDRSMEPVITISAQCSVDLTKRTIRNGKFYLIKRANFHGIRALFVQSDGCLLLKCKNKEYPDEKILRSELSSLTILGYVYAWTNINPW